MRILFIILATLFTVHAQSIQQLIKHSIKEHPSLQSIKHKLSAMDERITLSQNFANPDVSFTVNDIQFNDSFSRNLEPMQFEALSIKQKFPWFGKLDAKEEYVRAQKKVILNSYDAAKVKLAENIRITAYTIKEIEARIHIVDKYIDVSKQNIKLYTSYASTESQNHTNSMNASLLLTKVKIKKENYISLLKSKQAQLTYLVNTKIKTVNNSLKMRSPKNLQYYINKIENNPLYTMRLSQTEVAQKNKHILALESTPDPYVQVGYFNRSAYNNYASISIGVSIPLYGSEALKTEAARKDVLAATSETLDYKSSLLSEITIMYAKLTEAYTIYNILHNETLPQLEHMFELTQASIQQGGDLFTYTNLLEQKLNLEEESIAIKAEYFRTEAKLKSLIGEI